MIRTAAALVLVALIAAGDAGSRTETRCPAGTGFARLAYVKAGALLVVDMPACGGHVLVRRGATDPVRWSADGNYVSFGGGVASVEDGRVLRGLRGVWSPRGHVLASVTARGGLLLRVPGGRDRRLLPEGFGAQSVAFDPTGARVAVGRARPRGTRAPANRELWVVDVRRLGRRLVYRATTRDPLTPVVRTWPLGGFVLFSRSLFPGSSANLDGLPLLAVAAAGGRPRRVVEATLAHDDFVSPCAGGLAIAAGADRVATRGKRLVLATPPVWRAHDISRDSSRSWIAPACSAGGRWIAASAGRSWVQTRFGLERRSITLLSADGGTRRRLTSPPPGRSDELPRWTSDGRGIFLVRSGPTRGEVARGALYVVRLDGRLVGPLADLGTTTNFYGYYGWADQTDLYVPRRRQSANR